MGVERPESPTPRLITQKRSKAKQKIIKAQDVGVEALDRNPRSTRPEHGHLAR